MTYTNQALVEAFLGRPLTDYEANIISMLVYSIERRIDKELGTTFKNDSALYGATRYFDGGNRHINISPVQNITSVQLVSPDGLISDSVSSDLYVTQPAGSSVIRSIDMRYGHLPLGYSNLKIVGDFTEYGSEGGGVPFDIQTIATRAVGAMITNTDPALGVKSESVEGHSVTYRDGAGDPFQDDPIIKDLMGARTPILLDDSPNIRNSFDSEDYDRYIG